MQPESKTGNGISGIGICKGSDCSCQRDYHIGVRPHEIHRITYIIRQIEKRCKIARLPDGKYLFHQAILCKHFFSFDYSADSLETEFFFFLDLPEIIL